jgi:2-polyprenyl-3-methyl-5-hydroxy-6-metoxy-1,4-benzoquinol methylase
MLNNLLYSPLADTTDITLIRRYPTEEVVQAWKDIFNIDISAELHGTNSIDLYVCNETGLRFFLPLEKAGSESMYSSLQQFPWYYSDNKWEYERAMEDLKNTSAFLEVGCGKGAFLKIAKEHCIHGEGIELSSCAVTEGRAQGLQVSSKRLEDLLTEGKRYDAICAFQVLEHVQNPKQFLENLQHLMNPGGLLILAIPNGDSYLRLQHSLLDRPPHHVTQWTKSALLSLPRIFPLKLERLIPEPLSSTHIQDYSNSIYLEFHSRSLLHKLALNRLTMPLLNFALSLGRKHLYGHSWYACYKLVGPIS